MPTLNVDNARSTMVIKRGLSPGFAGIDNERYYMDNTHMLFGNAKAVLSEMNKEPAVEAAAAAHA